MANTLKQEILEEIAKIPEIDTNKDTEYAVIPDGAFRENQKIERMVIPDGVTEIGDYAFDGCTGLTEIHIPDSVMEIGDGAFEDCSGLKTIVIHEGLDLSFAEVPDGVTIIER